MINNKPLLVKTVLILIILISLGIVAYLSLIKKTPPAIIQPTFNPTIPTPTFNIDVSDWKTYRNDKYGFEFKYPNDFSIEEPVSNVVVIKTKRKEYLQIQSSINSVPPTPQNYIPNYAKFIGNSYIGGKNADKYYTNNPQGEGGVIEDMPYTDYVVVLGDKRWTQIDYYGEKEIASFFEKILSTFKFIEK